MDHNVVVRRCRQERGCFQRRRGLRVSALLFVLQRAVKETKPKEGYNYLQCAQESSARCIEGGVAGGLR